MDSLFIDADALLRDLNTLAQFGTGPSGLTRIAYSPIDLQARDWVDAQLRGLGCAVRRDAVGNTIAFWTSPPTLLLKGEGSRRAIAIGSHTDTVPNGGRFDGALGVLAAIACARALQTSKLKLKHPLEIINFMAEEATLSGGTTGSQIMAGLFNPQQFEQKAWDGRLVREHFAGARLEIRDWRLAIRRPDELAAYMEMHIEQGDALIRADKQIGVVEGIVGIRRYRAVFEGYANHAGTTPMHSRDDALVRAAPFVQVVRDVALAHNVIGTVGKLDVMPGAPNVIPGRVEMIVELRALHTHVLDEVGDELGASAIHMGGALEMIVDKPPTHSNSGLLACIEASCDALGLTHQRMPSGAFHDAASMAAICPTAMIFVPSVGGVSHSPDEFTRDDDCVNGANVLLNALVQADEGIRDW
jgi:beta-ureidopropionase / N-carbamoyl-L-amino-acid hydrolase